MDPERGQDPRIDTWGTLARSLLVLVVGVALLAVFLVAVRQLHVDACRERGGSWSTSAGKCVGLRTDDIEACRRSGGTWSFAASKCVASAGAKG